MVGLLSLIVFLSSFLLFSAEMMFSKMVLPYFGGGPSVWNTCMFFYQITLLLGYAYAHFVTNYLTVRSQTLVYGGILLTTFLFLPISLSTQWINLDGGTSIVGQLIFVLFVSIGIPLFFISITAPLCQRWLAVTQLEERKNPYFLYSASNLGSFIGLFSYPFLIEYLLPVSQQKLTWSLLYILLAALIVFTTYILFFKQKPLITNTASVPPLQERTTREENTLKSKRLLWALYSFVPSSLMLGVTTHLTVDLAPIPFLWSIPLGLYLLSFIIVFQRQPLLKHEWMVRFQPFVLIPLVLWMIFSDDSPNLSIFFLSIIAFFFIAMVCHGELYKKRPAPFKLTEFYVWVAIGGSLGGLFNSLLAPLLFNDIYEYSALLVVSYLLRPWNHKILWSQWGKTLSFWVGQGFIKSIRTNPFLKDCIVVLTFMGGVWFFQMVISFIGEPSTPYEALPLIYPILLTFLLLRIRHNQILFTTVIAVLFLTTNPLFWEDDGMLINERNFFGVSRVNKYEEDGKVFHCLTHGTTTHGIQCKEKELSLTPTSYYHPEGPLGDIFATVKGNRVAILGMGSASSACYGKPGQVFDFYEIDPLIAKIARDNKYFTFFNKCAPQSRVILGDARLKINQAKDGTYDVIIVDTFSSDAIPIHLFTKEAFEIYFKKLKPSGLLAIHISNRFFDLKEPLGNIASALKCRGYVRDFSPEEESELIDDSTWAVMSREQGALEVFKKDENWEDLPHTSSDLAWTDNYSNVLKALHITR